MTERPAYSYRNDPSVPKFDDKHPVAVMDGTCALCSAGARLIDRFDRSGQIRICPATTDLGRALLRHHGMDADDPESWLFLVNGHAYESMDAWIRAAWTVGGAGRAMQVLRILPRGVQDWLYRRVARNRYQIFGRTDLCAVAKPSLRARLIG
jgi:predicted DCC family thiol-disulfide oxidoreductase YuxK